MSMRYAKDVPEAEDFMQDAFVALYRDLYQYKPTGALGAWVRRVAVNSALQQLRKKRMVFADVAWGRLAEEANYSSTVVDDLNTQAIMKMVQDLPDGYRVVFNMYVVEGYSHKEIGQQLGITENTSKSQLSRAKKALRKLLEQSLTS